MSVHDIDDIPAGPFARTSGEWLCVFCESHIGNPTWFCQRCKPYKELEQDALEEEVNPFAEEAERQMLLVFGERARGWENAAPGGNVDAIPARCALKTRMFCTTCNWPLEKCRREGR